jgi:hypothetical protein
VPVAVFVAVVVAVGVAVLVGVAVALCTLVRRIAWAVIASAPEVVPLAGYVGDALPADGAARSAKASVKPSFDDAVSNRLVRAVAGVTVGAVAACPP